MSNTPIIDKLVSDCEHMPTVANNRIWAVARELERESDSLRAELEMAMAEQEQLLSEITELKKLNNQMLEALEAVFADFKRDEGNVFISTMQQVKAAIRAAKGAKE
jgi:inorganic pyrophosphatase